MTLQLTNHLPPKNANTTFDSIECGTVFEYEEAIHIKVNEYTALVFVESAGSLKKSYWVEEDRFSGDEEVTIIESELILKSRRG